MACTNTKLQLVVNNQEELATKGRSRGLRARGICRIRIGSEGKYKRPIWAELPVTFHRELPAKGDIVGAVVHKTIVGTQDKWSLRLIIRTEAAVRPIPEHRKGTMVAVHLGWRMLEDRSLRVAVWAGSDGRCGELVLDPYHVRGDAVPDGLESVRDKVLNRRKPNLIRVLRERQEQLPAWLVEATATISLWQSQSAFIRLANLWRNKRMQSIGIEWDDFLALSKEDRATYLADHPIADTFPDEAAIFRALDKWRVWDKHLLNWAAFQRLRVRRRRMDMYRVFAKMLAYGSKKDPSVQPYEKVVITNTNWVDVLSKADTDEKETQTDRQRHIGRLASPGQLSTFCKESFAGDVVTVPEKHVTNECNLCHTINKFDHLKLEHTCTGCGVTWDQDTNGALNQLARGAAKLLSPTLALTPDEKVVVKKLGRRNRRADQFTEKAEITKVIANA